MITEQRSDLVGVSLDDVDGELRPSLVRRYSQRTLGCYKRRLAHYDIWCSLAGVQSGAEHITTAKVLDYTRDQIARWADDDGEGGDPAYRRLRPETIKQGINALVFYSERSAPTVADDREAKELLRRFTERFNAQVPPAWRVAGRRSPRPRRRQVPRPLPPPPAPPEVTQPGLFDLDQPA